MRGVIAPLNVRAGRGDDLEQVTALRTALWPEGTADEHRAEARAILSGTPPSTLPLAILVAEDRETLAAFVEVGLRSHADGCDGRQPVGFIEGWYVLPEYQRRGTGRALMEAAEAWACEHGARELASDALVDNVVSLQAHAALGFEIVDRCVHYRKTIAQTPRAAGTDYYGEDLARIHHQHYGAVAQAAARELLARLDDAKVTSGTVVDLAAGTGILARAVTDAGFSAWGVDISENMLRIARSEAPRATFVHDSLWSATLPPCVAVTAIGEALCYAADPRAGTRALRQRFASIFESLAPGGIFLFDVAGPGRSGPAGSRRAFWTWGDVDLGLEEVEQPGELTRIITVHVPEGARYRRSRETHVLRLYEPTAVEQMLDDAGFEWGRLRQYGEIAFPGWHAYAARKRA
jgi:aminoglycoside 6'-N-acetyltransferase I